MKKQLILANKSKQNLLIISLFVIAVLLITFSLFGGGVGGLFFATLLFTIGVAMLFLSLLSPWRPNGSKYYIILSSISTLLFIVFLWIGVDFLVNMQLKMQIPGHWAEDMVWSIGIILIAGIVAGLIGFLFLIKRN